MRENLIDILFIILLVLVILGIGIFAYNSFAKEDENTILDEMAENQPVEISEEAVLEEPDELIVKEYEIDGKMYEVIAVLNIPALEIEYPVLSSTSKELLKISLNKYWGPNPNKKGNFCILGHNYNDDRFLGKLHNIKTGEKIQLTDMSGKTLDYYVYDMYIVDPDDTSCTSQLTDGEIEITLITCTKDFKQRLVVKARAEEI